MAKTKEKFHDPNQQKFANIKGFSLVAPAVFLISLFTVCLLYTSDAADE